MLLQLLVPHYKEPYEVIKPLLTSIAQQQGIDFNELGVIICNDGDDVIFDRNLLKKYPFDIQYVVQEHRGVSATRQTCLDMSTADYVMFCDTDDMFINLVGIQSIFFAINENDLDMISSAFVQEDEINWGKGVISDFSIVENNQSFIHGKIFRRQYLIDKNIRWNADLKIQEDEYFAFLSYGCLDSMSKYGYMEQPFYLWKLRKGSASRDDKFMLKTYVNVLDSYESVIKEFLKRGDKYRAQHYCCSIIYDIYFTMNKPEWLDPENKEYRDKTTKRFVEFYKEVENVFDSASPEMKKKISKEVRDVMVDEGMDMEVITFNDWMESLKEYE